MAITATSSLLRVSAPLSSASLLSASAFGLAPFRLTSLARFTCFVTRPEPGSCHLYTGSPRNQQFRILFRSSPEIGQPWILIITCSSMPEGMLTMLHRVVRLRSPSWFPHDGIPVPPFPHPFTTSAISAPAACGCLHPTPISRVRWTFHHLCYDLKAFRLPSRHKTYHHLDYRFMSQLPRWHRFA
jgi:hypothetical protein